MRQTLKTITRGFVRGGETSSSLTRYTHQILNIEDLTSVEDKDEANIPEATIASFKKEIASIHSHTDDPMVITARCDE